MTPTPPPPARPWPRRLGQVTAALLVLGMMGFAGWLGHQSGQQHALANLRADTNHKLDLFAVTAAGLVNRLQDLPATVQLNRDIVALFKDRESEARLSAANDYLRRLNAHVGSVAVFVADERGTVIASSNLQTPDDSQLGQDLSYRPYYQDALSGRAGRHFAVGAAPDQPGYFFSYPIHDAGRVVGVAVTKVSLGPIVDAFPLLGTPAVLTDSNQVVILSSQPAWRYTSLKPVTVDERIELEMTGMYGAHRLAAFPLGADLALSDDTQTLDAVIERGSQAITGANAGLLVQGRTLDGMDWRLLMFSDLRPVRQQAWIAAGLAASLVAFVLMAALFVRQRHRAARQKLEARQALERANAELEDTVAKRTQALTEANTDLKREMVERIQAEHTLRAAQDDLVQAAKLAMLGQLSSGITHELAQPLGAMRTLAGNASEFLKRNDPAAAQDNLHIIGTLVDRLGDIIHPLKAFARKSPVAPEATEIEAAVRSALFLLGQRVRAQQVQVDLQLRHAPGEPPLLAWCNRNRLEQVLINLIGNAVDAMQDARDKRLGITAWRSAQADAANATNTADLITIEVTDSGHGIAPEVLAELFKPFFTTKPTGSGLGLGLVISRGIAQDYGGELSADNRPEGGARFTLKLPAAQPTP